MTLRTSLHEYVRDTVDVAVHDAKLPVRPMMPAIVQTFVGADTVLTHSNPSTLLPRRVQFDAYANNDAQADDTATKLLLALNGFHGPMGDVAIGWIKLLNDMDFGAEDLKGGEIRYRRSLDFEVAYQERGQRPEVSVSS